MLKETAGYAISSKTAFDIFGSFSLVSDFKQIFVLTLIDFT